MTLKEEKERIRKEIYDALFYNGFSKRPKGDYGKIPDFKGSDIAAELLSKSHEWKEAKTIFFNGPVGLFENEKYEYGTKEIIKILNNTDAKIIIGGGDTVNAAKKYKIKNAYLSTGGGAALKYLEDKNLPGIIL